VNIKIYVTIVIILAESKVF